MMAIKESISDTRKKIPEINLVSIDEAMALSRGQIREYHNNYLNPVLVKILGLLNFDKKFVRAAGIKVWDSDGREYLDFLGGYGAVNLGHNHPEIYEALAQVKDMPNLLQASLNPLAGALAHNIAAITPGKLNKSFFCNSGTEAVEGALKLARISTGRSNYISCEGAFHGKSIGSLSVSGREKYRKPFMPLIDNCSTVPFGDSDALSAALASKKVAAFIIEPVQGEGGVIVPPQGYLSAAKKLCEQNGTLLILDEVQTGLGRTGKMFACEHEDVVPDILCLSKSLGGGFLPVGAYITTDDIWKNSYGSIEKCLLHTSTFGGNTLAMAAAIKAIEITCRENLPLNAKEKGAYLLGKLQSLKERHPLIRDVRGIGLLVGLEFNSDNMSKEFLASMIAGELLNKYSIITAYTLNNPNVIRIEPPLTVTYKELDIIVTALDEILRKHKGFFSLVTTSAKTMILSMVNKQ